MQHPRAGAEFARACPACALPGAAVGGAGRSSREGVGRVDLVGAVGRLCRVSAFAALLACAFTPSRVEAAIIGVFPLPEVIPSGLFRDEVAPGSGQRLADIADDEDQVYLAYFGEDPSADLEEMTFAERLLAGERSPHARPRREGSRDARVRSQIRRIASLRGVGANRQVTAKPLSAAVSGALPSQTAEVGAGTVSFVVPLPSPQVRVRLFFGGTELSEAEVSQSPARMPAFLDTIVFDHDARIFQAVPLVVLERPDPIGGGARAGNDIREGVHEDNILFRLMRLVLGIMSAVAAVDAGTLGLLALGLLAGGVVVRLMVRRAASSRGGG